MKKTVQLQELRSKDKTALFKELLESQQKLSEYRLNLGFAKVKNFKEAGQMRKRVARIWAVINEKSLAEAVSSNELEKDTDEKNISKK